MIDFEDHITEQREVLDYKVQSFNPYGFWKVISKVNGGPAPKDLSGTYTSLAEVEKAIVAYKRKAVPVEKKKQDIA